MNIAEFPTELLQKIFEALALKDMVQCSIVCRRFNKIIVSNFSKYYIDSWSDETRNPVAACRRLLGSATSIVAIHTDRADLIEFHPFSKRLFRTASALNLARLPAVHHEAVVVLDTSLILFWSGIITDDSRLLVYNLKSDREIAKISRATNVDDIKCGRNVVAVRGGNEFVLYSWTARRELVLMKTLKFVRFAQISDVGRIAIQPVRENRIKIFDLHSSPSENEPITNRSKTMPSSSGAVSIRSENSDHKMKSINTSPGELLLSISRDGKLLAMGRETVEGKMKVTVHDISANRAILERLFYNAYDCAFSDDSRFLLVKNYEIVVIDLILKRTFRFEDVVPKSRFCCIRVICGDYYVQMVGEGGAKLHKLEDSCDDLFE